MAAFTNPNAPDRGVAGGDGWRPPATPRGRRSAAQGASEGSGTQVPVLQNVVISQRGSSSTRPRFERKRSSVVGVHHGHEGVRTYWRSWLSAWSRDVVDTGRRGCAADPQPAAMGTAQRPRDEVRAVRDGVHTSRRQSRPVAKLPDQQSLSKPPGFGRRRRAERKLAAKRPRGLTTGPAAHTIASDEPRAGDAASPAGHAPPVAAPVRARARRRPRARALGRRSPSPPGPRSTFAPTGSRRATGYACTARPVAVRRGSG